MPLGEFLAVAHHQLLIGLGAIFVLIVLFWVISARRARIDAAALRDSLIEAQTAALGPVVQRIETIEERVERELAQSRRETAEQATALRQEVLRSISALGNSQRGQLEAFAQRLKAFE